jgi:hypothetical protein
LWSCPASGEVPLCCWRRRHSNQQSCTGAQCHGARTPRTPMSRRQRCLPPPPPPRHTFNAFACVQRGGQPRGALAQAAGPAAGRSLLPCTGPCGSRRRQQCEAARRGCRVQRGRGGRAGAACWPLCGARGLGPGRAGVRRWLRADTEHRAHL